MKLTKIEIQSVKSINRLTIELGKKTQIIGANGKGKTAVIQAIRFLMEGSTDTSLINKDEDIAQVVGYLQGKQKGKITRQLKRGKNNKGVQATRAEINGMVVQKPQEFLNKFLGIGTFDPREVLDPKKRTRFIMELIDVRITEDEMRGALGKLDVPLPFIDFDNNALDVVKHAEDFYFHNRTERNREAKQAKLRYDDAVADLLPKEQLPKKMKAVGDSDIERDLIELRDQMTNLKHTKRDWQVYKDEVDDQQKDVNDAMEQLKEFKRGVENATRLFVEGKKILINEQSLLANKQKELGPEPDIAEMAKEIQIKIDKLREEQNIRRVLENHARAQENVERVEDAWETVQKKADDLGFAVDIMRTKMKAQIMKKAEIPIEGLSYDNGEFLVDGKSIDSLSTSEQLFVGLTLVQRRNKETNIICIDAGECMDEKTYAALEKKVMDDGFNYVITKVGKPFKSKIDQVVEMH